jgi:hypothetical protein
MIKAGGHLRRQANYAVPLDILCEIVNSIQDQDLFHPALVNWLWNGLVNRRLWRCFRLHTGSSISITSLHERLDALLRLPSRARCIQRLIVGPITWQWDADLLQKMIYLWATIPFLSELTFDAPHTNPDVSRGGEFAPVLRGLLLHGSHLRLHSFTYSHYMIPNSPLEHFLMAQPSIRTLSGICSRWKTFPAITPAFLPALRVISCGPELTTLLAPSRPLVAISCTASEQIIEKILDAIVGSGAKLVYLDLRVCQSKDERSIVRRMVQAAPELRMMHAGYFDKQAECRRILGELTMLEDLVCFMPYDKWNEWDPVTFAEWIMPCGPRLERVIFYSINSRTKCGGVWERTLW